MAYQRVLISKGKYCYSGPNCKRHGTQHVLEKISKPKVSSIDEYVKQLIPLTKRLEVIEQQYVCSNPLTSRLDDKISDIVRSSSLVRWCGKHDGYHVYPKKGYNKVYLQISTEIVTAAKKVLTKQGRSFKELNTLHLYGVAYYLSNVENNPNIDAEFLSASYPEEVEAFEQVRWSQQERGGVHPREPVKEVEQTVPASNVSDDVLLQYWKCGRKRMFGSQENAVLATLSEKTTNSYKCDFCDGYHNGHGDGTTPISVQLVSARKHWNQNPSKVEQFVRANKIEL